MSITTKHVQLDENTNAVQRVQDVEPILEDVKQRRSLGATHSKGPDNHWHLASFPFVVVETYCNSVGITFAEFMRNEDHIARMLNDPDLSGFRIHEGRA
jgi:hypothetical protein